MKATYALPIERAYSKLNISVGNKVVCVSKNQFTYKSDASDTSISQSGEKLLFAQYSLNNLITESIDSKDMQNFCKINDFYFYGSGYQSWGYGGETEPGKYEKKYIPLVPQFAKYITMPGLPASTIGKGKKLIGQFIVYFRWGNTYLVVASTGNTSKAMPPVEFALNRKQRILQCTLSACGKKWEVGEKMAELSIFSVDNYFALRAVIKALYNADSPSRFEHYKPLSLFNNRTVACGWESWYNHYNNINEDLISDDLNALVKTGNIIKTFAEQKTDNIIFQVDDGWEIAAGEWQCDMAKFPSGMANLVDAIVAKGYVPGIWVAPFIIDYRCETSQKHPDWLLKGKKGRPIEAGYNPNWGAFWGKMQPGLPCSFYCLDLSLKEVQEHLDSLMNRVINEWGFRYIKLDFLYAGLLDGMRANGGASYEWYEKALSILTSRQTNDKGESVFYLGCGMPFETSFNHFPLSRIGPDTKEDWEVPLMTKLHFSARVGAKVNMQSTLGHAFWNESVFINDPDVLFLRDENITLDEKEKILIALVNFLFAGQIMYSDDPTSFKNESEGSLTRKIVSLYTLLQNEEFGLVNKTREVYLIFSKSGQYCGVINLSDKSMEVSTTELLQTTNNEAFSTKADNLSTGEGQLSLGEAVVNYCKKANRDCDENRDWGGSRKGDEKHDCDDNRKGDGNRDCDVIRKDDENRKCDTLISERHSISIFKTIKIA